MPPEAREFKSRATNVRDSRVGHDDFDAAGFVNGGVTGVADGAAFNLEVEPVADDESFTYLVMPVQIRV